MTRQATVLVVDDEPAVCKALELALDAIGLAADSAATAEEALAKLGAQSYQVILLDNNLPGMNGLELMRRLRTDGIEAHVVMMTAHGSRESALEALELGIDAYLEKPFDDISRVADRVARLVELPSPLPPSSPASAHFQRVRALLRAGAPEVGPGRPAPQVLVAGADAADRDVLARVLGALGARVTSASTSREVLEGCEGVPPDVLIADEALTEPAVEELVGTCSRAGIVCAVTHRALRLSDILALIDRGVRALIEKPLREEDVRKHAERLLAALAWQPSAEGKGRDS